jgi:hypothetical protein
MIILFFILFILGCISYVISLFFIGSPNGEIFSDTGNGIMLTNTVLILLRSIIKSEKKHKM